MTTIEEATRQAHSHIDLVDIRLLLQHVLGVSQAYLLAHADRALAPQEKQDFDCLVLRRIKGEPVAYLTGECGFYSQYFKVSPAVLIPRPETELLVDLTLERLVDTVSASVLDLGTGSGAVALTVAVHRPHITMTAVDLSEDALAVARLNAVRLGVDNVEILAGNWFDSLSGRYFDCIISNPPYIALNDPHLDQGDLRFEPSGALAAGVDGLDCIRTIVASAPTYLLAGGWLLFEHGYNQATACRKLLEEAGFRGIFSCPDLAGIPRVSGGQYFR